MTETLLDTPFHQQTIPLLINFLKNKGATYNVIVDILTNETPAYPVDVQLLLTRLVRDGILNVDSGVYRLNHNEETEPLFTEAIQYYKRMEHNDRRKTKTKQGTIHKRPNTKMHRKPCDNT